MSKWDKRFLELAAQVATWSKDPSTKVGAVIVNDKNRIISMGFNGLPRTIVDKPLERDVKLLMTIHAEQNALLFAQQDVTGMTCYVTRPPCAQCAAKLIQAGISRVVWLKHDDAFASRWAKDIEIANLMYYEANVTTEEHVNESTQPGLE